MREEKRNLRLLSFRKQRGMTTRGAGDERGSECEDGELRGLLGAWTTPAPSHAARTRLLSDFRRQQTPAPLWRRLLTASLPVPAPVAALVALALVVLTAAALAARTPVITIEAQPNVAAAVAPVRAVEVPTPQEKIVTRIVYVERGGSHARHAVEQVEPSRLANVEGTRTGRDPARVDERNAAGYFTRVDMAEFQPAAEMKIRIVGKGEKR